MATTVVVGSAVVNGLRYGPIWYWERRAMSVHFSYISITLMGTNPKQTTLLPHSISISKSSVFPHRHGCLLLLQNQQIHHA
ncbi:hypothetical protein L1987_83683 [Smallanthus sonchifolius]|uniref:Uncharacterized protein n=1 Tax=Smallanthus sonchifolius TaxID=185202 RepID=A0ACB8YCT7_9ASTR|nr:hypothetical protein L1987_83683 [Smallanthus sonchifolius]